MPKRTGCLGVEICISPTISLLFLKIISEGMLWHIRRRKLFVKEGSYEVMHSGVSLPFRNWFPHLQHSQSQFFTFRFGFQAYINSSLRGLKANHL